MSAQEAAAPAPGQAPEIPDAYTRYTRAYMPQGAALPASETARMWKYLTGPAERRFWAEADAMLAAGDRIVRDVLESLCRRDGLPLESSVVPGEPARNYDLALRLGIGHVFGMKPPVPDSPAVTPAVARPPFGSVLVLAVRQDAPDESVRAAGEALAAMEEGVTVVTVCGVEALRVWEPGTPGLADGLLRNIDQLHDLVRDIFEAFPDTADEQDWRDRAGALHVHDPDGKPYRALTEDDLFTNGGTS